MTPPKKSTQTQAASASAKAAKPATSAKRAKASKDGSAGISTDTEKAAEKAYRSATKRAEKYKNNPEALNELFESAANKSRSIPRGPFNETWAYLMAMFRLIQAYASGTYREIPWQSMAMIIGAVVYFVSPLDAIPDFIPVVGYLDDAFVVGLALSSVQADLERFMEWELNSVAGPA